MDIKHRKAYARIKMTGIAEPVLINEGVSLIRLLSVEIPMAMSKMPTRYNACTIDIDFKPMGETETHLEAFMREVNSGLDLSNIEIESDESEASELAWAQSPMNPDSESYDPLYAEYIACASSFHRARKTPADLGLLRKHIESNYADSPWWDGAHKW